MDIAPLFGLLGSITAASLFLPQTYKSYKTKKTGDLSYFGIILGMLNGIFWVVYGAMKSDPFIYVTNAILLASTFFLFVLKKKYN